MQSILQRRLTTGTSSACRVNTSTLESFGTDTALRLIKSRCTASAFTLMMCQERLSTSWRPFCKANLGASCSTVRQEVFYRVQKNLQMENQWQRLPMS